MNTKIGITGEEVAVVVGTDTTVTGTIRVKESIATEAGAAVQVLIIVEGANMMTSGVVEAGPLEVSHLLGLALNLEGAPLLVGHLQGVRVRMHATATNALLAPEMFHHSLGVKILQVLVNLMLMNDGIACHVTWGYTSVLRPCVCILGS